MLDGMYSGHTKGTVRAKPPVSPIRRAYRRAMRAERKVLCRLPTGVTSRLPAPRSRPFNGQEQRAAIVREIATTLPIERVIETGTFRGATADLLAEIFDEPVATVESDPRFHACAVRRVRSHPCVEVVRGDSREFLRDLAARPEWRSCAVFAYLDAHWDGDLPLPEELRIIARTWERAVVMIDDFEVPDDPGYGFDDYGPEVGALTADILPPAVSDWSLCYPAAPSSEETGRHRGCCVLLSPAFADVELSRLRRA